MKKMPARSKKITTIIGGIFGLALAYAFLSRALSTGSYWHYLTAVIFLYLGVKLLNRSTRSKA